MSNKIPPTSAKRVVPIEPKKKARPDRVPLIFGFMFLMKSTSTQMNYMMETTIIATQRTYECQSLGLSMYWNENEIHPLMKKLEGIISLGSALSLMKPKIGATIRTVKRAPVTIYM